ncbi:hypothetical protein ASF43_19595 [Pseudorhodoferax sp. Leaf267]|nr:hypothetical protein ASF43_19595 [Pseudorhodoferax sp. Leaf267]
MRAGQGVLISSYGTQPGEPAGDNAPGIALQGQLANLIKTFSQAARTHQTVQLADAIGSTQAGTAQQAEELRRRGWGEVGAMSYAPFLVWLENALNDVDDPHAGLRVPTRSSALLHLEAKATTRTICNSTRRN